VPLSGGRDAVERPSRPPDAIRTLVELAATPTFAGFSLTRMLKRLLMSASAPDDLMTKTEAIVDVVMAGGAPSVQCKLPSMPLFSGKSPPR
jgi:hypothetical protein